MDNNSLLENQATEQEMSSSQKQSQMVTHHTTVTVAVQYTWTEDAHWL